jgi:hypothetical protein
VDFAINAIREKVSTLNDKQQILAMFALVIVLMVALLSTLYFNSLERPNYCRSMGGKLYGRDGKIQCVIEADLSLCRFSNGGIANDQLVNISWKEK